MPKTLLVVDDSATMRKVFEMTFAGEDIAVVTHDGSESLLARARDARPSVAVVDVALGHTTGYDVCKALKSDPALGKIPVLLLYSEQSPLDQARAQECGADGSLLKPFDTQTAIDKVKQVMAQSAGAVPIASSGPARVPAAPPMPPTSTVTPSPRSPTSAGIGAVGAPPSVAARPKSTQIYAPAVVPSPPVARPAVPSVAPSAAPRRDSSEIELVVEGEEEMNLSAGGRTAAAPAPAGVARAPSGPAMPAVAPSSSPATAPSKPAMPAVHPSTAVATAAVAPAVAAVSAEVNQRIAAMGLTPAQIEAITALTREVVERVVWEVVPPLAETLIREEIRRLTSE